MNAQRTIRLVAAVGACVGILLTYRVIADLRAAVDAGGVGIPGIPHILACWPVLIAVIFPANLPNSVFYGLVAVLNAATFGFLFFSIANITRSVLSRVSAATEER